MGISGPFTFKVDALKEAKKLNTKGYKTTLRKLKSGIWKVNFTATKKLPVKWKHKNPISNPGIYIGVKVHPGGKVSLKLPNKNPGTLAHAKKVASKLGMRLKNPSLMEDSFTVTLNGITKDSFPSLAKAKKFINELKKTTSGNVYVYDKRTGDMVFQKRI